VERYLKHKFFEERGLKGHYNKGVETLRISSWDKFHEIIQLFNEPIKSSIHGYRYSDFYIWRGQRRDWSLKSSFDRRLFYNNVKIRNEILNLIFKQFNNQLIELQKLQMSEKLENKFFEINFSDLKEDEKDQVWAIGQHNGLLTPLFDWTEDPYIAAYFAFYENNAMEQSDRVVYALNIKLKELMAHWNKIRGGEKITKRRERFVEFLNLQNTFDNNLNKRLEKQKSRFTKALNGKDIEKNVKEFYRKKPDIIEDKLIILAKIFITDKLQDKCLDYLKNNGITHIKLFPDYNGAVEGCKINLHLENFK